MCYPLRAVINLKVSTAGGKPTVTPCLCSMLRSIECMMLACAVEALEECAGSGRTMRGAPSMPPDVDSTKCGPQVVGLEACLARHEVEI